MANKLVLLAATLLAAMMVLTQATRTTIITTEVDTDTEFNPGMGQCQGQMQWPHNCEQYMKQMMRHGGGSPHGGGGMFEMCCDDLRMMEPSCQCQAMKMLMKEMGSSMGGSQMMQKVMVVPMMCGTMQRPCPMSSF